jgi:ERCC4-related helicase
MRGQEEREGLLVDMPTGLGKTAMAILWWLWRRRGADYEEGAV